MKQKVRNKEAIVVEFVCLGNICRSPMAEGIFRHLVEQEGLADRIEVRSAGTERWNVGNPPHRGTQEVLRRRGIDFSSMRASLLKREEIERADYLIAMDQNNVEEIQDIAGRRSVDRLYKLMDFVPNAETQEVPGPLLYGQLCADRAAGGCVRQGAAGDHQTRTSSERLIAVLSPYIMQG